MIQTAGGVGTNNINRSGYGSFPLNTGDWTIFIRFKWSVTPANYVALLNLFDGLADYSQPYLFLGTTGVGTDNLIAELYDGVSFLDTASVAITHGAQNWAAVTYNSSTHSLSLIVNGSSIGSVTANASAIVWDKLFILGDGSAGTTGAASVAYCRAWSNILSAGELTAEAASILAVKQTGLIWDCPLQASIDLTAHNNTLNQLVGIGTVTTDTTDPLLSVTAAPPVNIDPANAITITSNSVIFADVTVAGNPVPVFYKYTPPTGTKVVSMLGRNVPSSAAYNQTLLIADSLSNANSSIFAIGSNTQRGIQTGVDTTLTYYIKVQTTSVGTPNILQISVLEGLDLDAEEGDFAIPDDSAPEPNFPLPCVYLDRVSGYPKQFITDFVRGEGGCVLDNGRVLATNEQLGSGDGITKLYSESGFTFISQVDLLPFTTAGSSKRCIASNKDTKYLVCYEIDNDNCKLVGFDDQLVQLFSWTISTPSVFLTALGVIPDFSKAYLALTDSPNKPIRTVDLSNGSFLSDLNAGVVGYNAGRDILCISTNVILVPYWETTGAQSCIVRKYDSAGTVLATFNYDSYLGTNSDVLDFRLCRYLNDNSFILWLKTPTTGKDIILKARVSDGVVEEQTPTLEEYETYQYIASVTNTPARFGHSESCPLWVVRATSGGSASGLYKLTGTNINNARVTHDRLWVDASLGTTEDVAIPNPFAETYLVGDE